MLYINRGDLFPLAVEKVVEILVSLGRPIEQGRVGLGNG